MNKSIRIFVVFSGIYLSFLTFILLTQPVSGISATAQEVWSYYLLYLPFWALAVALFLISGKIFKWNQPQTTNIKKGLTCAILFLVLVGFVTNYDYQRQVGCLIVDEHGFSLVKVVVSVSSITFIFLGYYIPNNKLGVSILIFEFLFWTSKALYFNSSLNLYFPGYFTMTSWILRVILIASILNSRPNGSLKAQH